MNNGIVFLVGFMGSGKTTVGQLLADALGYAFVDTDEAIIQNTGKSIEVLFAEKGETYFRNLESKLLIELCRQKKIVVATGGGMPIYNDNMAMMKKKGCVIYLSIGLQRITERLADDTSRPLYKSKTKPQLLDMMKQRRPIYDTADFKVLAYRPASAVVQRIIPTLKI
jgi:shikimate kinase